MLAPLISLAAFIVGAGAGGVLARRVGERHRAHVARAFGTEACLITLAAIAATAFDIRPGAFSGDALIAVLAFAMGVRNATVRRFGVPDLTTTVLTLTLTGLAADSRVAGGSGKGSVRRGAAATAMLVGAIAGALLLKTSLAPPLFIAAALALVSGGAYASAGRRAP